MSLSVEGQNLSANKIWCWPDPSNLRAILHQGTKFPPNNVTRGGVMMSYTISRWRLRWLNTSYGFVLVDVTDFERSICTREANFMEIGPPAAKIMISSILKMAAAVAQYYFRFRISWRYSLLKVKSCPQTKFGRHTLTHGCWKNKRPPYWNSTSGFDFDDLTAIDVPSLHQTADFRPHRTTTVEIWRHVSFQDGGRQPCCKYNMALG